MDVSVPTTVGILTALGLAFFGFWFSTRPHSYDEDYREMRDDQAIAGLPKIEAVKPRIRVCGGCGKLRIRQHLVLFNCKTTDMCNH